MVAQYPVQSNKELKLKVTDFNFALALFQHILSGANGLNGKIVGAYILIYKYNLLASPHKGIFSIIFIGRKPRITFIYHDQLCNNSKIREYRTSELHGRPILILIDEYDETNEELNEEINEDTVYSSKST